MNVVRCVLPAVMISLGSAPAWAQGGGPDSLVYVLSAASQFEVKTGKAGLFGFAGHTHVVRARAFAGSVVYYPSAPSESRVEITVPADSLEVLTPPDTEEIRKVTHAMRTDVLHVDEHPVIRFVSTGVTPTVDGFQVQGRLTLAGQTREVSCDVRVEVGTDTLRATGGFSVKQTDYGIRPYRGGPAGTVRVADRVNFSFEAVGIRSTGP
jgi:polyisoprenoid-binding protein YceI